MRIPLVLADFMECVEVSGLQATTKLNKKKSYYGSAARGAEPSQITCQWAACCSCHNRHGRQSGCCNSAALQYFCFQIYRYR
jgi:hypothetical protein